MDEPLVSGHQILIPKPSRIKRPGVVTTIEPGIYVRPAKGLPR